MQITRYRITDERGSVRYTDRESEAREAANAGKKVEKRRVLVRERDGHSSPQTAWKLTNFEDDQAQPVIQYRIYLNPSEHFDTLDRAKAVKHWREGDMIYSREVNQYPRTMGFHPTGYWKPHPPKEKLANLPDGFPELKEEDISAIENESQEDTNVSGVG